MPKQPPRVFERPVVARTEPSTAPARISATQPGKADDEATPKEPKAVATQQAPRAMLPPPAATGAKSKNGRDKDLRDQPVTPPTALQEAAKRPAAAPQAEAPARAEHPMTKAAKEEPSGNQKQREQAATPPQMPQRSPGIKPTPQRASSPAPARQMPAKAQPQDEARPGEVAPAYSALQQPGQKADSRDQRAKDKSGRSNDKKRDCVGPYCEE